MTKSGAVAIFLICCGTTTAASAPHQTAEELLDRAQRALRQRQWQEAVEWATKAINKRPDHPDAYMLRGIARERITRFQESIGDFTKVIALKPVAEAYLHRGNCYSQLDQHGDAIADFDRSLEIDPKLNAAYHQRGREFFKQGEIDQSIADFDRYIELEPAHKPECWERGLSRYFAGRFDQAQKSFEDYHQVGPEDIENGLWRLLSQAEIQGLPAAQQAIFTYEPKRRPPFPLLYELYAGRMQPMDVLSQATDGATSEAERKTRLFYAHLYVGMWHVVSGDRAAAATHLEQAVSRRSTDYMWYVARIELQRLKATSDR